MAEESNTSEVAATEVEEFIEITFVKMAGNKVSLVFKVSETIKSVKNTLAAHPECDCPPQALMLMKGSKKLTDETQTLAGYDITTNCKLRLIIRLMNVITQNYVQGDWIWCYLSGRNKYKLNITGNVFTNPTEYEFIVTENSFGFKNGNLQCTYTPTSIKPGIIKLYDDREKGTSEEKKANFWVRSINRETLKEMRKEWPECNYELDEEN